MHTIRSLKKQGATRLLFNQVRKSDKNTYRYKKIKEAFKTNCIDISTAVTEISYLNNFLTVCAGKPLEGQALRETKALAAEIKNLYSSL